MNTPSINEHRKFYNHKIENIQSRNVYSRFRDFSPILAERNFFNHLRTNAFEDYLDFLLQIRALSYNPIGLGLALCAMPEVNLCGNILALSIQSTYLNQLCDGKKIYSMAVSEKGWKGRIKNIQTTIQDSENGKVMVGSKGFATNGRNPDYYIVIAKIGFDYSTYLVPLNTAGLEIRPFDLNYAMEATHSEIIFHSILESKLTRLSIDYKTHAKPLRLLEVFSLQFILLGFIDRLYTDKNSTLIFQKKLIDLKDRYESFENNLNQILERLQQTSRFEIQSEDVKWGSIFVEEVHSHIHEIVQFPEWELFKILLPTSE